MNVWESLKGWKNIKGFLLISRKHFTSTPNSGPTRTNLTCQEAKLGSIYKRPSCQPTGTHPSLRSVLAWESAARWNSLSSTCTPTHCTHWSLMGNTAPPHCVVTRGRRWLVQRPPCSTTVTKKGSMPSAALLALQEQELVLLVTTKTIAAAVTPESGLVQRDILKMPTHVET